MWKPSGRVWWRARARPPDGESSSMPFVETSISNHATPRLIHLRPGAKCFEGPEKGSPILRGADSAATGPSTDKAQRSAVFLLFQFPSLLAYLRYSSLSATRHLRPRFCAQIPAFHSRLALSPPPTTSSRPLPSPISVHDPEQSLDCIFCRHRPLFFQPKSSRPFRWVSLCSVLPPPGWEAPLLTRGSAN